MIPHRELTVNRPQRLGAAILTLLVVAGAYSPIAGCRRSEHPKEPATRTSSGADPLTDAPADWDAFLAWADEQLRETPQPVPPPAHPRWGQPSTPIFRLDQALGEAEVDQRPPPPETGPVALLTLGPFRSDRPQPRWRIKHAPPTVRTPGMFLTASGFSVLREQIGQLSLEIKVPWGRHLDVTWSRAGTIRLPVPDNSQFWTLSVTTDGFAEWSGPLSHLTLQPDGVGPGVIEVRKIEFLGRTNAYPKAVGRARVSLGKEMRNTIYAHIPSALTLPPHHIPRGAKLQTGVGMLLDDKSSTSASTNGGGVTFELLADREGHRTSLLRRTVNSSEKWIDLSVSLEAFAEHEVSFTLKVTGDERAVAFWGNPIVYQPATDPPVVMIYLIDALAAKHLSLYGYDRTTAPTMAALAEEGVWFANAFANSPRTVSSVPDLLFSLPTERHGVDHPSVRVPLQLVSLAEALRGVGFATASFCTNVNAGPRQDADQGFDHFFDRIAYWWNGKADRTVPIEDVLTWMDIHRDRPMFIYIHTAEPHAPYFPPEGYAGKFDTGYRGPIDGSFDQEHGFMTARTDDEIAHVVSLYDEECLYADARLGLFLDALENVGLRDRINLLVTADHGEEFLEHGHWLHGRDLHNEIQRVPLVAVGPGITARGRVDCPVQLHDLMPTILDLYDVPEPYVLAGRSLRPLLQRASSPKAREDSTFADAIKTLNERTIYASNHSTKGLGVVEGVVIDAGRWKLMYGPDKKASGTGAGQGRFELYDIVNDPGERDNIIDQHRDVARRLTGKLVVYRLSRPPFDPGVRAHELDLDLDQLRELQSLGYVGEIEANRDDD